MKKEIVFWVIGFFIIFCFWEIGSFFMGDKDFPSVAIVTKSIFNNFGLHSENFIQTLFEASVGLTLSILISTIILTIIGVFPESESAIYPFMVLIKATPVVAFIPIIITFHGTGTITKIIVSSMLCFFPLVIGGIDGIGRTPERIVTLTNSYGGKRFKSFFNTKKGYLIDGFLSGMKTAAPLSVVGAIVGEYVIGNNKAGLGSFIITNLHSTVKINLYAGAVLSTLLGLFFFTISALIYKFYDNRSHIKK